MRSKIILMNTKEHWETVYENKTPDQVSWTEEKPEISLKLIQESGISKSAKIIDIGGGDSKLVDYLLEDGYTDITVLDISATAIEKAKKRIGPKSNQVDWIVSDVTNFQPNKAYDLWHDRATFHFLTTKEHVDLYTVTASKFVEHILIVGTFSKQGPTKCSGLEISQYDAHGLAKVFEIHFKKIKCLSKDHITPFGTAQNFQFCSFKKLSS